MIACAPRASCRLLVAVVTGLAGSACLAAGDEGPPTPAASSAGIEDVYQRARPSLAVVTAVSRDRRGRHLGTGFVISADGLIATNLHVIGEGRPIEVQMADGRRYDVTSVHATDRVLDLAILRVDAHALTPLPLGDSDDLRQGQSVVAIGNPLGLQHSVVSGVVSGRREIEGRSLIQLAIPVERGNSGGPMIDMQGRVGGILTLKSAITANLGFAVAINHLKPLLDKPNPVPIDRWVRQGVLDARDWLPVMGANWHTRGNRILVDGEGDGFGGRALCLATQDPPQVPFELAAQVRLDDESGAAGVAFAADGGDRHYGFYPSAGALRLTRFEGPELSNWTILAQSASPFYRPGDWNKLHVRVEARRITCSVNGHVAITIDVPQTPTGKIGLAKFRDTRAEFKSFRAGEQVAQVPLDSDAIARVDKLLADLPPNGRPGFAAVDSLASDSMLSPAALDERAETLAQQAEQLRRMSAALAEAQVRAELVKLLAEPEQKVDLLATALCVARLDNHEIDVAEYRRLVDRMADDIRAGIPAGADETARLAALNKFFFTESGFHGSRGDYYNRANSYLNDVLDDREGLPITLSIVYIELAKRLNLAIEGVGLPGHFVVRYRPSAGEARLIDVFEGGQEVTAEEAARRVLAATKSPLTAEQQLPATARTIVVRMLYNLLGIAEDTGETRAMMRYLDAILAISPTASRDRLKRAALRWRAGERDGAMDDVQWLLDRRPNDVDLQRVRELRELLDRAGT